MIEEALNMGTDIVGGIPWIEYTKENEQEHVDQMCELAEKYNKDISMLLDDVGDAAVQKYINEQAEESRREDSNSTAL